MVGERARLALVEYGAPVDLSKQISDATGVSRGRANQMVLEAGLRAAKSLGVSTNPISLDMRGARAADVAGLIRLGPALELEIAPKFLGLDASDSRWREDFFFLSTLSRHGRLLESERMSASGGAPRDLATLVARALTGMYQARQRRPLRAYRRAKETEFYLDGDPDPLDIRFPSPEGFVQEIVRFDRKNPWNAAISAAAKELLPEVTDAVAVSGLTRVIGGLGPQNLSRTTVRKPIPARHRAWGPVHDLSLDVLSGLGLTYKPGEAHAPGYVVATWRVWEDLLAISSRIAFGRTEVASQTGFALGSRLRLGLRRRTVLSVFPDLVVEAGAARPRFLVDAKYKGHVERGVMRIAEADVYEAMAFSQAAKCGKVALVYPATPEGPAQSVGTCSIFEKVEVGGAEVIGIQAEVRGISRLGALNQFAANLAVGLGIAVQTTSSP